MNCDERGDRERGALPRHRPRGRGRLRVHDRQLLQGTGLGPRDGRGDPAQGRGARGGHEPVGGRGASLLRGAPHLGGHAVSRVEQPAAAAYLQARASRSSTSRASRRRRGRQQGINDRIPPAVAEFASRVCRPEADALLCSCTAWRSVEAVDEIEPRTGKPVVTSNQSRIWAALRSLGVTARSPASAAAGEPHPERGRRLILPSTPRP